MFLRFMKFIQNKSINAHKEILKSKLHISGKSMSREFEEIRIPVPWGYVAGKWWGSKNERPILGIHGWQDNCGTFDLLVQNLPSNIPFLAIDLPGHGFSSRIPHGLFYNGFDLVILIKRIVNHYKWPKVSLIGHSLGGITSYLYTSTFPEDVEFLICFDTITPMIGIGKHVNCEPKVINKFLFFDEANISGEEPPSYLFEDLDKIMFKGSGGSVDLDKCSYILNRNIKQSQTDPKKYYFLRDPRVKINFFIAWFYDKLMKDGHKINCPSMEIEASNNFSKDQRTIHDNIINIFKESNKLFQLRKFEGKHHFHLNNPNETSQIINSFIEKYYKSNYCNL